MKYDCIIIGGGISGLTCGIKCAKEGLRTAIFSGGMNSLHFSSGSIDLLGYAQNRKIIGNPLKYLPVFKKFQPDHPYSKIPVKIIRESLKFLQDEVSHEDLLLYSNKDNTNHFRITPLGILKPTYLSQESVYNEKLNGSLGKDIAVALLNFEGFRDFYPELAVEELKKNNIFKNTRFITGKIKLSFLSETEKDILESSSIDIARLFESEKYLPRITEEIRRAAGSADIVYLPAFIGLSRYKDIHKRLSGLTGLAVYEIPSLPPSILGMRIDNALKSRFSSLGGEFIAGDKVVGGEIINGNVDHVHTANYGDTRHYSKYFVLSTGSFISGGLRSGFNYMEEPIFKLRFKMKNNRDKWYSRNFFDSGSHPFLSFGVETNRNLNPYDKDGTAINNLYCAGSVLSDYDPIKEGSGGGVAVSTAYYAALNIIKQIKGSTLAKIK